MPTPSLPEAIPPIAAAIAAGFPLHLPEAATAQLVLMATGRRRIGPQVTVGAGTVIVADDLQIGAGAVIGAGVDLRGARIRIGENARIGDGSRLLAADEAVLGAAAVIDAGADVTCRVLRVGDGSYCGPRLRIGLGASMEQDSTVTIGARCQIAPDVAINATAAVRIGDGVGISSRVTLWTHGYHSGHHAGDGFVGRFDGIIIEDGVWLAFDVAVLPGVVVGAGTIVGVRSLVNRSLPSQVLAVGVPARVKSALVPAPVTAQQLVAAVGEVLQAWLGRLEFKGLRVAPAPDGVFRVGQSRGGAAWTVRRHAGEAAITIISARSATAVAVFDFGRLRVDGVLDELGHDLRDFCRRRSWSFPYDRQSPPIVPARFARLLEVAPAAEAVPGR